MKKSIITLALIACAVMLFSCGNNGNKKSEKTAHLQFSVGGYPKIVLSRYMKKGRSDTPLS